MTRYIDLEFQNHGSIFVVVPFTEAGKDWLDENVGGDAQVWGRGIVVEPRYVEDILVGAEDAGLRVS
jgi:hypothetical protein